MQRARESRALSGMPMENGLESGAAICTRLGHPEDCACWLPVGADAEASGQLELLSRAAKEAPRAETARAEDSTGHLPAYDER